MNIIRLFPNQLFRLGGAVLACMIMVMVISCSDDEQPTGPQPEPDFTIDKAISEPGVVVRFTNNTPSGDIYEWDFGDGNSSQLSDPQHIYEAAGKYTITLTVTGSGGQTAMSSRSLVVSNRRVIGFTINNIPLRDGDGSPWDSDFSGPELIFSINRSAATTTTAFNIGSNITQDLFPLELTITGDEFDFTDEPWQFILYDNDEPFEDLSEIQLMAGLEGNPTSFGAVDYQTGIGTLPILSEQQNVNIAIHFVLTGL